MSKQRFEVVSVDGRGAGRTPPPPAAGTEQETRTSLRQGAANPLPSELRKDPIPKKKDKGPPPRVADDALATPGERSALSSMQSTVQVPTAQKKMSLQPASDGDLPPVPYGDHGLGSPLAPSSDDRWDDVGLGGSFFEGFVYLVKTAPSLVVNPLGTIRQHIETAPVPAVQKLSLVALLAPSTLAATFVSSIAGVATAAAAGAPVSSLVVGPIVAVIAGGVGALLGGFLGHPILSFLIRLLGGTADARARTTHLTQGAVAGVLVAAVLSLAGVLLALTTRLAATSPTFHLIVVVPALLGVVAWPAPVLVQWQWFKAHGVARWFQTLLLVLAVLALVGGLASAGTAVWGGVEAMRATAGASAPSSTPPPPPEAAAGEVVAAAGGDATPLPSSTAPPTTPPPAPAPATAPGPTTTSSTPPRGAVGYAEYARRRAQIEAALEANPMLVNDGKVERLYKALSSATWRAEQDAEEAAFVGDSRRRQKDPSLGAYVEKLKRAKVYEKTSRIVDELSAALGEK